MGLPNGSLQGEVPAAPEPESTSTSAQEGGAGPVPGGSSIPTPATAEAAFSQKPKSSTHDKSKAIGTELMQRSLNEDCPTSEQLEANNFHDECSERVDNWQTDVVREWAQATDHPFPYHLVDSDELFTRMDLILNLRDRSPEPGVPLKTRPIVKSSPCQEKVFKKLSGDDRRIFKCGRAMAEESKESYLSCTIIGFRGRECAFAEPVGTCGFYEIEARILVIDEKSNMINANGLSFIDLPVARDIEVYELERISDGQSSDDVMSLIRKPVWRIKSYRLDEKPLITRIVYVEMVQRADHAVLVSGGGPWCRPFQLVHMGSSELPEPHTFLLGQLYHSKHSYVSNIMPGGALVHCKFPLGQKDRCRSCGQLIAACGNYFLTQLRPCPEEQVRHCEAVCQDEHKMSLVEFSRKDNGPIDLCIDCVMKKEAQPSKEEKKSRSKGSSRKKKENSEHDSSQMVADSRKSKCGDSCGLKNSDSADHKVPVTVSEQGEGIEAENTFVRDTPPAIVRPDPIRCNLCLSDIRPTEDVYFKVSCLEDCRLFSHKRCLVESLAGQGLRKKREYKDGICPTEGCSAHLREIYEFSVTNEESLYLKCAEKWKLGRKTMESLHKKDKKNEHVSKVNDRTVVPDVEAVANEVQKLDLMAPVEVPAPPPSTLPVRAAWRPVLPPPKPNRSVPLPVDIENVVPLVKEKDPLEDKYAVSEQHHKKTKPPSNKKKNVLDIEVGIRREPHNYDSVGLFRSRRNSGPMTLPTQSETGRGRSRGHRAGGGRSSITQTGAGFHLNNCKNCNICLEEIGEWQDVVWCPHCIQQYHTQCIRTWLSTNSTCPQCRRNWPDPVEFPALSEH